MNRIIVIICICISIQTFAQKINVTANRTIVVGHLLDSALQKNHIHTEFSFGKVGGIFSTPGPYFDRSIVMNFETSFKAGFFPVKKLLIGWDFTPQFSVSDFGLEGFRWHTGPFVRYYVPFYRVTKKNELKSPVALFFSFNYYLGQYNPMLLNRPFDSRFTTGFSLGMGFTFKLKKNLCLNIEFGPRYDFFAPEFANSRLSYFFKIGLSYSFPSKIDQAKKKYSKIEGRLKKNQDYSH